LIINKGNRFSLWRCKEPIILSNISTELADPPFLDSRIKSGQHICVINLDGFWVERKRCFIRISACLLCGFAK
jgi:hypothetical protein